MAQPMMNDNEKQKPFRRETLNRGTARDPGAQGIGARLRTEEVDPYHHKADENKTPESLPAADADLDTNEGAVGRQTDSKNGAIYEV